jgi:alkylated DNA repair dioxygenase AlkB
MKLSETSWIEIIHNSITTDFDEFWKLCPKERHEIKIYGKTFKIPRFQQFYSKVIPSYRYSGTISSAEREIPNYVQECIDKAFELYPDIDWNGTLVNWYRDGSNYISPHSDDEKELVSDIPILSFSFGGIRTFRIKNKKTNKKLDIPTLDGSIIVMGGDIQKEYTHEITKTKKFVNPRINVTVRSYKTK